MDKLSISLEHLNGTLAVVNSGEGTLGKLVSDDELYNSLVESSQNLALLIDDLKKNPGKYISLSVFGSSNKSKNK